MSMKKLSRRTWLSSSGSLGAALWLAGAPNAAAGQGGTSGEAPSDVTGALARYMVAARDRDLPAPVTLAAKHRLLDTLGAMVSGTRLKPGEMAIRYVRAQG